MGGAFAAGCVPSGRLLTRLLTGESLDEIGDGKPGSSNVARSVGWKSGAAVFALDAGKAYVPATAPWPPSVSAPCSATSLWSRGAAPPPLSAHATRWTPG